MKNQSAGIPGTRKVIYTTNVDQRMNEDVQAAASAPVPRIQGGRIMTVSKMLLSTLCLLLVVPHGVWGSNEGVLAPIPHLDGIVESPGVFRFGLGQKCANGSVLTPCFDLTNEDAFPRPNLDIDPEAEVEPEPLIAEAAEVQQKVKQQLLVGEDLFQKAQERYLAAEALAKKAEEDRLAAEALAKKAQEDRDIAETIVQRAEEERLAAQVLARQTEAGHIAAEVTSKRDQTLCANLPAVPDLEGSIVRAGLLKLPSGRICSFRDRAAEGHWAPLPIDCSEFLDPRMWLRGGQMIQPGVYRQASGQICLFPDPKSQYRGFGITRIQSDPPCSRFM